MRMPYLLLPCLFFSSACAALQGQAPSEPAVTNVTAGFDSTINSTGNPTDNPTGNSNCGSVSGGPQNNPVTERHPDLLQGRLAWTQEVRWACVYNIEDFSGSTDFERYEAAKETALAQGGGVIYFPAGIYQFSEDLQLANGIVLRGEASLQPSATASDFAPQTQLVFPKYEPSHNESGTPNETAFKKITTRSPATDSNLGLVHLDLNRAAVDLSSEPDPATNRNLILLGLRSNNVAEPDPRVPNLEFQSPWLRYSYRFAANFRLSAQANILVANNRLNDAVTDNFGQPGYQVQPLKGKDIVTYTNPQQVPFDYANHYGIVVNRSKASGFTYATEAQQEPGLFRPGVSILDNWVYHTMRVGIHASGQGLLIRGNEIRNNPNKTWWTDPTGQQEAEGSVTFENRAIDWSGHDVTIQNNRYQVYRHRIRDTPYLSIDGEGILIQECCGGTSVRGLQVLGNQGNGYIGLYKVPSIEDVRIEANQIAGLGTEGGEQIYVNADPNGRQGRLSQVVIANNQLTGHIHVQGSKHQAVTITNNSANNRTSNGVTSQSRGQSNRGDRKLTAPCGVNLGQNPGLTIQACIGPK